MLEVIAIIFLRRTCNLFGGFVVPVAGSDKIERNAGKLLELIDAIDLRELLFTKMTSKNFDTRKSIERPCSQDLAMIQRPNFFLFGIT